jgi:peptidoglycan/xylan/chitin deacetylase (PgdA/CDA1 family)
MTLLKALKRHATWAFAPLLLPLSIVPIVLMAPALAESHDSFKRLWLNRGTVAAPNITLTATQKAKFVPLPTFRGAVPVITYHGINPRIDSEYTVTPRQFAQQMAMLQQAGFHPISAEQYARFPGGSAKDLPSRPILITFDDGQLDSYRYADPILRRFGFRATMFVITDPVDRGNPFYLRWDEFRKMRDSGRWDLQLHAGAMHKMVRIDAKGTPGAAYANRQFVNGRLESFAAYQRRVTNDLDLGMRRMREELGPVRADAFAYPFSADGSWQTNDKRIPAFLDKTLHARFSEVFDDGHPKAPPRTAQRTLERREVNSDTTAEALYDWLAIEPRTPAEIEAQEAAHAAQVAPATRAAQTTTAAATPAATAHPTPPTARRRATHRRRTATHHRRATHRRKAARRHKKHRR